MFLFSTIKQYTQLWLRKKKSENVSCDLQYKMLTVKFVLETGAQVKFEGKGNWVNVPIGFCFLLLQRKELLRNVLAVGINVFVFYNKTIYSIMTKKKEVWKCFLWLTI
jgi:hypothetical protein